MLNHDTSINQIVFVLPAGFTLSGVTIWTMGLAQHLVNIARPISVLTHNDIEPTLDIMPPSKIDVRRCQNQASPFDFYTHTDLVDYLADYRAMLPATIILNGGTGSFATCALLAKEAPERMRLIGVAHADEPLFYDWLSYYEPILHKFIAVSDRVATRLGEFIPHRRGDIVTRPCAVEVPAHLNRSYSLPAEPIRLMYAGRLIEQQKRVSDLIRLVEQLEVAQVDFRLRIVGEGPDKPKLQAAFETMGATERGRVTLSGNVPPSQMSDLWQTADMCLLVSDYEGTSVSMLEAMAAGCVPVVTEVSGTAGVIQPGVNGFLTTVGAVEEMAQVIKKLAKNRVALAEMGTAAHQTVVANFSYERYVPWFLTLVDQTWCEGDRSWPEDRSLHRHPPLKERIDHLSGEQLSQLISAKKLLKAIGFKIAAQPALRWLYWLRGFGKKLLGG